MKRTLINIFLMGFSVVTLLFNIGDVCNVLFWRIFFFTISAVLLASGIFIVCNKAIPNKIAWIVIFISVLIAGAVWYHYNQYVDNVRRNELWREDLRINQDKSVDMNDLEKSAILDNDARSQYHLAENYLFSKENYPYDFGKAKDFAQKAADQGYPKANALLAAIYLKGYGFEPDYSQAFANIILSIKGGYEQSLSLLPLLDSASLRISPKDSIELHECINNRAFLDSLYDVISTTFSKKGWPASHSIVLANEDRCLQLFDAGYYRAADILYCDAFEDSTKTQERKQFAQKLFEYDRVPDKPIMRSCFFEALKAVNGEMMYSSEEEVVKSAIQDQDFIESYVFEDFDKDIHDLTYRYEYDLAYYQRSKYLLANRDNLNSLFLKTDDDLDMMYANAKQCLIDCTAELRKEMISRPHIFTIAQAQ